MALLCTQVEVRLFNLDLAQVEPLHPVEAAGGRSHRGLQEHCCPEREHCSWVVTSQPRGNVELCLERMG